MSTIGAAVPGTVLRLDPRRRAAVIGLPKLGEGRSFRTDAALPGEELAPAVEFGHGTPFRRNAGAVTAVRMRPSGAEVDVRVTDDASWQRLAARCPRDCGVHLRRLDRAESAWWPRYGRGDRLGPPRRLVRLDQRGAP